MPNSLRAKISSLRYKGKITEEEYKDLISKLDGHDKALRTPWIPCHKELPEIEKEILMSCAGLQVYKGFRSNTPGCYYADGEGYIDSKNVLAWMPCPESYKEEGE